MSVNDRGGIKWTAMMMPEHIELLKQTWQEQERKQKPIIDEQKQEEINLKLQMAVKNELTIDLKYFLNHDFYKAKGKVVSIDRQNRYIKVAGQYLPIESIIDAWID